MLALEAAQHLYIYALLLVADDLAKQRMGQQSLSKLDLYRSNKMIISPDLFRNPAILLHSHSYLTTPLLDLWHHWNPVFAPPGDFFLN